MNYIKADNEEMQTILQKMGVSLAPAIKEYFQDPLKKEGSFAEADILVAENWSQCSYGASNKMFTKLVEAVRNAKGARLFYLGSDNGSYVQADVGDTSGQRESFMVISEGFYEIDLF